MNYLSRTDEHPSARKIFQEARKEFPGLSLATVYNTLEALVGMGLIRVMDFQGMDNRHETNLAPHVNLICKVCGKIQDFGEGVSVPKAEVRQRTGFEVKDYRIEYYGICAECRGDMKKEQ